jgi:ATP-dependent RNA helicase RhlE
MLDMGFIRDVRKIIATLPAARQSLLFSATMPGDIAKLATSLLKDPIRVEVTPVATTAERIVQKLFYVEKPAKNRLLAKLMEDEAVGRAIVFSRTKHGANKIAEVLGRSYKGGVEVIHGNKSQSARQNALESFRAGKSRVLIATDIAARGIDVDGITHVINFDLPNEPESYVHRIGRTARAGAEGIAWSFCDGSERAYLKDIEKLTRQRIFVEALPDLPPLARGEAVEERAPRRPQGANNGGGRNGSSRNGSGGRHGGPANKTSNRNGAPHQGGRHAEPRAAHAEGEARPPRAPQGERSNENRNSDNRSARPASNNKPQRLAGQADFRNGDYRDEGSSRRSAGGNTGLYRADARPTPAGASEGERPRGQGPRRQGGPRRSGGGQRPNP